jgi:hypothetical protein
VPVIGAADREAVGHAAFLSADVPRRQTDGRGFSSHGRMRPSVGIIPWLEIAAHALGGTDEH